MLQFYSASNGLQSASIGLLCVRSGSSYDVEFPLYFGFSGSTPINTAVGYGYSTSHDGTSFSTILMEAKPLCINPEYSATLPSSAYRVFDGRVMLNESAFSAINLDVQPITVSGSTSRNTQYAPTWDGYSYEAFSSTYLWSSRRGSPAVGREIPATSKSAVCYSASTAILSVSFRENFFPVDYGTGTVYGTSTWTTHHADGIVAMFSGNLR